jgi:hypothetical protein
MHENTIKLSKFQQFWLSLPRSEKGQHRRSLLILLGLTDYTFYYKLRNNSFKAHERAVISEYFRLPQQLLFPSKPVVFEKVNLYSLSHQNIKTSQR